MRVAALGSVGEVHRRHVLERKRRQTILGLVTVASMLLLGAAVALFRL